MVRGDWIKPGAVVIDVGINAVDDATDKRGYSTQLRFFAAFTRQTLINVMPAVPPSQVPPRWRRAL
jgi:5,10-methylene-tetrahydrofolate dehydrogenase/methenyl tetrahydrofolate cyclohydrolase